MIMTLAAFYSEWIDDTNLIFSAPALFATTLFMIFFIIRLLGVGGDIEMVDSDGGMEGHFDTDGAMMVFSLQGILVFLMVFGWSGLTARVTFELGMPLSALSAFLFGAAAMYGYAQLMLLMGKLNADGNVTAESMVGLQAVVYVQIPAAGQGQGQVKIVVGNRQRFMQAVSQDKHYDSQTLVHVKEVLPSGQLVVVPVGE